MTQERHTFTDAQWQRIEPSMPPCKGRPGGAHRGFFYALLWMARTSAPWRDLPERLGAWSVVYQRAMRVGAKKAISSAFSKAFSSLEKMMYRRKKPVRLVLDGLPAHKNAVVKDYVASTAGKLRDKKITNLPF